MVGFDGSDESIVALHAAIGRAGPDDTIAVVHAYPRPSEWIGYPYYNVAVRDTQEHARHVLEKAADTADAAEANVTLEMHEGTPAEVLTRLAALREADEIIVGTRGLGRLRAALGSVAQEVVRTADRPVLVTPVTSEAAA